MNPASGSGSDSGESVGIPALSSVNIDNVSKGLIDDDCEDPGYQLKPDGTIGPAMRAAGRIALKRWRVDGDVMSTFNALRECPLGEDRDNFQNLLLAFFIAPRHDDPMSHQPA